MIQNKRKMRFYFKIKTPDGLCYFVSESFVLTRSNTLNPLKAYFPMSRKDQKDIHEFAIENLKKELTANTGENVDELSIKIISYRDFQKNIKHTTKVTSRCNL